MLTIKLAITKLILSSTIYVGAPVQPDYAVAVTAPTANYTATVSTEEIIARLDSATAKLEAK